MGSNAPVEASETAPSPARTGRTGLPRDDTRTPLVASTNAADWGADGVDARVGADGARPGAAYVARAGCDGGGGVHIDLGARRSADGVA